MFEKSINQFEVFFFLLWIILSFLYVILTRTEVITRIDYDIYTFVVLLIISIALGYKKIIVDGRGITKSPYLIPSIKKTKTWSEIKHMAHISIWSQGKYGILCENILGFIDNEDKICFKIKDETRKSKYNYKTGSIETEIIKPPPNFSSFINFVKSKEETYETELIMEKSKTWLGKKVDYENNKNPKIKRGFFS